MDLKSVDLLQLQTAYMKNDKFVIALCKALNPHLRQISVDTEKILIYSMIDFLDERIVDELAIQMHVDFYDSELSVDIKRKLVKESVDAHKRKGTPAIVEEMASIVFGRAKIKEWFEYNGQPYHFKAEVEISKTGASQKQLRLLDELINAYKNTRSFLERIDIYLTSRADYFIAATTMVGEEITVYPWSVGSIQSKGSINISTGTNAIVETSTVYPKANI